MHASQSKNVSRSKVYLKWKIISLTQTFKCDSFGAEATVFMWNLDLEMHNL